MNILKEIVFGKEGVAEREQKAHHQADEKKKAHVGFNDTKTFESSFQKKEESVIDATPVQCVPKQVETKPLQKKIVTETSLQKNIEDKDTETATETLKNLEIRSGVQTVESTKDPESTVAVSKEAILQEKIKPVETIEVQPVIHRQREQMELHQINENINQTEVLPTVYRDKELPAQFVGEFREDDKKVTEKYLEANSELRNTMEVDVVKRIRIVKEPIVEEHVHKTIVEVVQPIIHKETFAPVVIRETLPLYEKVVEAPTLSIEEHSINLGVKVDPQIESKISEDKLLQVDQIIKEKVADLGTLDQDKLPLQTQ